MKSFKAQPIAPTLENRGERLATTRGAPLGVLAPVFALLLFGCGSQSNDSPSDAQADAGTGAGGLAAGSPGSGAVWAGGASAGGAAAGGGSGAVGGAASGGGGSGGGDGTPVQPGTGSARCAPPALPTRPATGTTIGDGTAASCTESALASALKQGGHIQFRCGAAPVTITVTREHFVLDNSWLDGAGKITFDGNKQTRMFRTQNSALTVFKDLKFIRGYSDNHDWETERGGGAAIYRGWMGKLYVLGCTFEDNEARDGVGGGAVSTDSGGLNVVVDSTFSRNKTTGTGGGLYSVLSDFYLINSTFSDNQAEEFGGGVSVDGAIDAPDQAHPDRPGGPLRICGGRFERNKSTGSGGGATMYGWRSDAAHTDKVTVEDSLFMDNEVASKDGYGGGLYANSLVTIRNSTFARNRATTSGGGVWVNGDVTIENSTAYKNHTEHSGGGIAAQDGSLRLRHVTVAHNSTGTLYGGAGGVVSAPPSMVKLYADNSIIAWNTVAPGGWVYNCLHGFSGAGNVEYTDPTAEDVASLPKCREDFIVADPLFAAELVQGEGPVPTLPIAPSSAAARAGKQCAGTDARGKARPETACAAGAYQP